MESYIKNASPDNPSSSVKVRQNLVRKIFFGSVPKMRKLRREFEGCLQ